MKRTLLTLTLALAAAVPVAGRSLTPLPAAAAPMHVTLKVAKAYKHNMHFAHTMAGATLAYTKHEASLKVTAQHLPKPSAVKAMAYVVWLVDGKMKARAGALKFHSGMAGLKAMVMMTKVQDVVVTAEHSATTKHPMGPVVLSGMVG